MDPQNSTSEEPPAREQSRLLGLPQDLVYVLVGFLDSRSMSLMARTCWPLFRIINPELYRLDRLGMNIALAYASCHPMGAATLRRVLEYSPEGAKPLDQHYFDYKSYLPESQTSLLLTPLIAAVRKGNYAVIKFLLAEGATVHLAESYDSRPDALSGMDSGLWSPIHYSVTSHALPPGLESKVRCDILTLLLASGADPNQLTVGPRKVDPRMPSLIISPLDLIIRQGQRGELIPILLDAGAPATHCSHQEYSPVSQLIARLNFHIELNAEDYETMSFLVCAGGGAGDEAYMHTTSDQPLLIELLSVPRMGETLANMTELLLKNGVGTAKDRSWTGDTAIVHFLKCYIGWVPVNPYYPGHPRPNETAGDRKHAATTVCHVIDHLLAFGADINEGGTGQDSGDAAVHVAVGLHWDLEPIFKHILNKGANIRARRPDGCTVLHTLVCGDTKADPEMVTCLARKHGVPRHAKDRNGDTFLHYLMRSGVEDFSRWAKQVAKNYKLKDMYVQNRSGVTPLQELQSSSINHRRKYGDLCEAFGVEAMDL